MSYRSSLRTSALRQAAHRDALRRSQSRAKAVPMPNRRERVLASLGGAFWPVFAVLSFLTAWNLFFSAQ